jgi:tetratricopeptide (TPR) repeat protein
MAKVPILSHSGIDPTMPAEGERSVGALSQQGAEIGIEQDPRVLASLQITGQGKTLLEKNKPDDAIRTLERAISLDPANGLNYYYLADAWIIKGNYKQAQEVNRLAHIYLNDNVKWNLLVIDQRELIESLKDLKTKQPNELRMVK